MVLEAGAEWRQKEFSVRRTESFLFSYEPRRDPGTVSGRDPERFAGQGRNTLRWLTEECIPYIEKTYDVKDREYWLTGYSLAGLFALWAAYECDMFSGIVCCSGSMWFKDWAVYVREHKLQHKCRVYLSLGGKEEKTKNKVMATVGERTREQERILREDPLAEQVILEWNAGGHFADSGKRLAKGIRWLLMNNDERR